jgi:hypothetical protein
LVADREVVDYTKWSKEDLVKLRALQREEGAGLEETDVVDLEIRRREPARAAVAPPVSAPARVSVPVPALVGGQPFIAPTLGSDPSPEQEKGEAPPFQLRDGAPGSMAISRYAFVRALTAWLWFVALAIGLAGASLTYYVADGTGSLQVPIALAGAIGFATPYLSTIVFMKLASEAAQGVTWITAFLHDQR